jgi:hypothetical protein
MWMENHPADMPDVLIPVVYSFKAVIFPFHTGLRLCL